MADHFLGGAGGIDLAVGNPYDVSHLPPVSVDIATLLESGAGVGFQPLGLPALREAIAGIHGAHGLHVEVDEVHVTSGCHQAIGLAIGALTTPREGVAVSMPCYPGLFDILGGLGNPIVPLRADRSGILPESLDAVLGAGDVGVVYLQAGPHNPTGAVTPPQRLRALAAVLDRYDAAVVEDLTLADLAFAGRPQLDLAHLCRSATVVSVGSFSKVLWGGLRVGWIRGPIPVIDRTMLRRLAIDLGPATPSQLLCLALLPHLDAIVAERRSFLESNVRRGASLLAEDIPEWHAPVPDGGSVLWAQTPLTDTAPLVHVAHRHGVHVAPGSIAVEGQRPDPHLRICLDRPWPLVEAGLQRLGAAWRDMTRERRRVAG
jgi:DNA-binding transcriptional MocR family regulator